MRDDESSVSPKTNAYTSGRVASHPYLGELPPATPVRFTLDGQPYQGREGEPILAALLANGVRICRTMPNSGEARGGYCLIGRCSDCLMIVNGVPSVQACVTPLVADMAVATQHGLGTWAAPALDPEVDA